MTGNEKFNNCNYNIANAEISRDEKTMSAWRKLALVVLFQMIKNKENEDEDETDPSFIENLCKFTEVPLHKIFNL